MRYEEKKALSHARVWNMRQSAFPLQAACF